VTAPPVTAPPVSAATAAVVICAYTEERWDDLSASIDSVTEQRPAPAEVIVVIDHNDALLDRLVLARPEITVVANAHGRGLSGARNTGVETARAEVVVFLDDDARARPGWLAALTAPFADPTVMGAGGSVQPAWAGPAPAWLPPAFLWVVGCSYEGLPTETAQVRNPIGASMAFRRSCLTEIGGFTERLGRVGRNTSGCEETELCIRASHRWPDRRHVYVPGAVVDHHVPETRSRWDYFVRRCYSEGQSKALVATMVGAGDGLRAERSHAARVLPRTIGRSGRQAVETRRLTPLGASVAVGVGVAAVGAGLTVGSLRLRSDAASTGTARTGGDYRPVCVLDHRIGRPFPAVPSADPEGRPYHRALVLVRAGSQPVGMVAVDLDVHRNGAAVEAAVLAEAAPALDRLALDGEAARRGLVGA
jgi:GT2 family glycosyltransferase